MKNKKLNETRGIITNNEKQWDFLCDLIVDYIYDIKNGLNTNPFYDPNNVLFDLYNITSYYKYIHSTKMPQNSIPNWVKFFTINLIEDYEHSGCLKPLETTLSDDNKLEFVINIQDYVNKNPDSIRYTLVHEFRHAYTKWLELSKNITIFNLNNVYSKILKLLKNTPVNLIKSYTDDTLTIDENIFNNSESIKNVIIRSIYYTNNEEVNSYLQEFASSVKKYIKDNKVLLDKDVLHIKELKRNYNKLSYSDKWDSNILNGISLTPFKILYFRIYAAYQIFWNLSYKIDEHVINDAIELIKDSVLKYYVNVNNKDNIEIFEKIKKMQISLFNNIMIKFYNVYAHILNDKLNEAISLDDFDLSDLEVKIDRSKKPKQSVPKKVIDDFDDDLGEIIIARKSLKSTLLLSNIKNIISSYNSYIEDLYLNTNLLNFISHYDEFVEWHKLYKDIQWTVTSCNYLSDFILNLVEQKGPNVDLSWIDTSKLTSLDEVFSNININADLSTWDVSNVKTMINTFKHSSFNNSSIENWDVSSVTDMSGCFSGKCKFIGDLSNWDVYNVMNISNIFLNNKNFNNNSIKNWPLRLSVKRKNAFTNSALLNNISENIPDFIQQEYLRKK